MKDIRGMEKILSDVFFDIIKLKTKDSFINIHNQRKGEKKMIADKITNLKKYPEMEEIADRILAFIKKTKEESLEDGRYELDGENLFALVQSYQSRPLEEGLLESHVLYNDLQYIVSGEEAIYWNPIDGLTVKEDKRPAADAIFYHIENTDNATVLKAGMFGYYMPTDGHMPCIAVEKPAPVKKIVFKIKVK